jgi:hypothetical protein
VTAGTVLVVGAPACLTADAKGGRLPVAVRVLPVVLALPLSACAFVGLGIGLGLTGQGCQAEARLTRFVGD